MLTILIFLFSFFTVYAQDDICSQPLKIGKPMKGGNSTLKYFFDSETFTCYRYRSEGGDDGQNSFETEETCRYRCVPMDYFSCSGGVASTGSCSQFDPTAPQCPKGSICKNGGMTSMCCPQDIEDAYTKEYDAPCPTGSTTVKEKVWYGEDAIRGKSCDHKFCPEGTTCVQGKWQSHCCRK